MPKHSGRPRQKPARATGNPGGGRRAPQRTAEQSERYGAADEVFWQHQETRLAGRLGQPCCTLSGMSTLLASLPGHFAVIIHGERDCGNCFVSKETPSAHNFFTTGLSEEAAAMGRVDDPLETCLRLVLEEFEPEAVLVMGTCLVHLIGADPKRTVDRVSAETTVPVVYLRTGGLQLSSQSAMADWLYSTLAGLARGRRDADRRPGASPPPTAEGWRRHAGQQLRDLIERLDGPDALAPAELEAQLTRVASALAEDKNPARREGPDHRLNAIGLPPDATASDELSGALQSAGITLHGAYPQGATVDAWRHIGGATLNAVADRSLYPKLLEVLEDQHGQPTVEVPLPVGLAQTRRFYRRIGEFFGVQDALEAALAPQAAAAAEAVAAFRAKATGTRAAMGVRMTNNYQADQLAYQGLGDVEALAELGFDLTLLVQGAPESRDRFAELLKSLGSELPFEVFPSPWNLAPLLSAGNFDVGYLADHGREEARKAGLPMLVSRQLTPLYEGVAVNLAKLEELLHLAGRAQPSPAEKRDA